MRSKLHTEYEIDQNGIGVQWCKNLGIDVEYLDGLFIHYIINDWEDFRTKNIMIDDVKKQVIMSEEIFYKKHKYLKYGKYYAIIKFDKIKNIDRIPRRDCYDHTCCNKIKWEDIHSS